MEIYTRHLLVKRSTRISQNSLSYRSHKNWTYLSGRHDDLRTHLVDPWTPTQVITTARWAHSRLNQVPPQEEQLAWSSLPLQPWLSWERFKDTPDTVLAGQPTHLGRAWWGCMVSLPQCLAVCSLSSSPLWLQMAGSSVSAWRVRSGLGSRWRSA